MPDLARNSARMTWKKRLSQISWTLQQRIALFFIGLGLLLVFHSSHQWYLQSQQEEYRAKSDLVGQHALLLQRSIFFMRNALYFHQPTSLNDLVNYLEKIKKQQQLLKNGGAYLDIYTKISYQIEPTSEEVLPQLLLIEKQWQEVEKSYRFLLAQPLHHDSTFFFYQSREKSDAPMDIEATDDLASLFSEPLPKQNQYLRDSLSLEVVNPMLTKHISQITRNIDPLILSLQNLGQAYRIEQEQKETLAARTFWFALLPLHLFLLILAYTFIIDYGIKPLSRIKRNIDSLSEGKVLRPVYSRQKDEISQLRKSLANLSQGLATISEFAKNVGQGNYDAPLRERSAEDSISFALLEMRNNLKINAEADRRRNWANEGIAIFGNILRTSNEDIQELSYQVISELVRYLGANQGAVYILQKDLGKEALVLQAAYAYDKRRYLEKEIAVGQGIIGQTVLEKEHTYLEQVPNGYTYITSGMGAATPSALLVMPLLMNETIYGVLEIASFQSLETYQIEFVQSISANIAATLATVKTNERTRQLLEESQMFTEQMRAQEEEMRQNMEELAATQEEMERSQRELRKKANILDAVVNNTKTMILALDQNFNIKFLNHAYSSLLRRIKGVEVPAGVNILEIMTPAQLEYWRPFYERALKGESYTIISTVKSYDYEDVYYEIELSPIYSEEQSDQIVGITIFTRDVTWLYPTRWEGYHHFDSF